jgi:hypothetical protein
MRLKFPLGTKMCENLDNSFSQLINHKFKEEKESQTLVGSSEEYNNFLRKHGSRPIWQSCNSNSTLRCKYRYKGLFQIKKDFVKKDCKKKEKNAHFKLSFVFYLDSRNAVLRRSALWLRLSSVHIRKRGRLLDGTLLRRNESGAY